MALYKVLLADDEREIRQGIINKINWEQNGFILAGDAANGQEAWELAEKIKPDVVMTDIKMPFMDGLELGRRLSISMPLTKLVLFSGFDDFEYAKQAIQMNATEYILKPIDSKEITILLQKLKKQLDEEISERRNVEKLRENYIQSLPILKQQFFSRLVEGKLTQAKIQELSAQYEIDLSAKCWIVTIVHADVVAENAENSETSFLVRQKELIPISLQKIFDENLARFYHTKSFLYNEDLTILGMLEKKEEVLRFVDMVNRVCKIAKRYLNLSVSAGIGSVCEELTNLKFSLEGAKSAVDYRVLMGDKAIYIDDMEPDFTEELHFEEEEQRSLINAIKLETPEAIRKIAEKAIEKFQVAKLPLNQYQIYLTELVSELLKVVRGYKLDMEEIFGSDFKGYFHLSDYESLQDLKNWLCDVCIKISNMIKRERIDSAKLLAEKAKQFVNEHYSDSDVSVEMLCSYLHVSPAYFSTIFKRETGVSFITYLTDVRMEEAIKLLNTTDDKTYIISLKVGYTEPNYFSYVFKKHFGVSPSKYRGS